MWDDKINKKIKDAADQYHPAYEDDAWDKMELLLNEHLPVKDNDKRKYLLFFLLLLLVGGSFVAFYKYNVSTNKIVQNETSKNNTRGAALPGSKLDADQAKKNSSIKNITSIETKNKESELKNTDNKSFTNTPGKEFTNVKKRNVKTGSAENVSGKISVLNVSNAHKADGDIKSGINNLDTEAGSDQSNYTRENKHNNATIENNHDRSGVNNQAAQVVDDTTKAREIVKSGVAETGSATKKPTKTKHKFSANFAIDFSAGPDVSAAGLGKAGKINVNYGLGLRYNLSSEITLHTGFYIADKVYSASKNDYHAPSSAGYSYLYNIDANCKVYEIPVTVSYHFGKTKNHQWFVGGGLSSYLMKKESYDYYYKYPSGYINTKSWSISNKNQHYFAVLDFSGGYQYIFNKRVSLIAEPYLKIPLKGVGAGKVKLNSGGLLVTLSIKPFYKKEH